MSFTKKNKANDDIRRTLHDCGMCQYELADLLGVHEVTLTRKLRKELEANEKAELLKLIKSNKKR